MSKTDKPVRDEADRPKRPGRLNFGGPRLKLQFDSRPGYHRCWMNDDGQTIQEAEASGYTFVEDARQESTDTGCKVRRLVGKNESGGALYAYLMEIRQEYFEEDQAKIAEHADKVDAAIRSKKLPQSQEQEKFYDRGVKMDVNTPRGN